MIELDHIVIATRRSGGDKGEVSADSYHCALSASKYLTDAGFLQGSGNSHPGQGTANFRFFIHRFMLEFLYVDDVHGLMDARNDCLSLDRRFLDSVASPLGICSRRTEADSTAASFDHTVYQPGYLPPPMHVQVASGIEVSEPLWFHLPFVKSIKETPDPDDADPRDHVNGARQLSACRLEAPHHWSEISQRIASAQGIELVAGKRHCVHLELDGGRRGPLELPVWMNLTITL